MAFLDFSNSCGLLNDSMQRVMYLFVKLNVKGKGQTSISSPPCADLAFYIIYKIEYMRVEGFICF